MTGQLFINDYDAYEQWGVSLSDGGFAALRTPPEKKERVCNKSRLRHGATYFNVVERYDERQVTLPIHIVGKNLDDINDKYDRFCRDVLDTGSLKISTCWQPGVYYRCLYQACTSYFEACDIAKFQLRLVETNPNNRGE